MMPQDFCCLPWCGRSFGAPYKRAKIRGVVVEYPQGIDFHHTRGRQHEEGVYICHECHMAHHDRKVRLDFDREGASVRILTAGLDIGWQRCVTPSGLESA